MFHEDKQVWELLKVKLPEPLTHIKCVLDRVMKKDVLKEETIYLLGGFDRYRNWNRNTYAFNPKKQKLKKRKHMEENYQLVCGVISDRKIHTFGNVDRS